MRALMLLLCFVACGAAASVGYKVATFEAGSLRIYNTRCLDADVLNKWAERGTPIKLVKHLRAAELMWHGRFYKSCWIEYDGNVFSIDETGDLFEPTPKKNFKDPVL